MTYARPLVLALVPLALGGLTACGSSGSSNSPSTSAPAAQTVLEAAQEFDRAMVSGDAATACKHIDNASLQTQLKSVESPFAGKDCATVMTYAIQMAQSMGQAPQAAKAIKVVSQSGDSAKVAITEASGTTQTTTWKLEGGLWKSVPAN